MYMSKLEQDFFLNHLDRTHRVLEWGSGESTLQIASLVKSIVSIEHDAMWFKKTLDTLPSNAKLILKQPNGPWNWGQEQPYELFKDYIEQPLKESSEEGLFDIVLIDGTSRENCASICKFVTHEDSLVFIHDFNLSVPCRRPYAKALDYLIKIDSCQTMAKFKVKR